MTTRLRLLTPLRLPYPGVTLRATMTHSLRTLTSAALRWRRRWPAAVVFTPAVSSACVDGETGVTNGCAPFCLPGKALDVNTGLCMPVPEPAPNGVNAPINNY